MFRGAVSGMSEAPDKPKAKSCPDPQPENGKGRQFREHTEDELSQPLEPHQVWIKPDWMEGELAKFAKTDLSGAFFSDADLEREGLNVGNREERSGQPRIIPTFLEVSRK